jgi:transposase, IS5 family
MINETDPKQLPLPGFESPFERQLDMTNRWVQLSQIIPWTALCDCYDETLTTGHGRPAKPARLMIAAVIIKHKLCLSDEETVAQLQENPYLQYFAGFTSFTTEAPFVPSLFVTVRRRMGETLFEGFHQAIIDATESCSSDTVPSPILDDSAVETGAIEVNEADFTATESEAETNGQSAEMTHQGKLIVDATVAEQAIRYPTDLSLLNEAREFSEKVIDELHAQSPIPAGPKPRIYRQQARSRYLAIVKQKRPGRKLLRKGIKQQLQYLRRNLKVIEAQLGSWPEGSPLPLPNWLLHRYWVIQHLYTQQQQMYRDNVRRCDHRIVSISQPHVRPIVRGKQHKSTEFGAKLSASLTANGIAYVDRIHWEARPESHDLKAQVAQYHKRYGVYPEVVIADPLYGSRENRAMLKQLGIRYAGKPLGRPKKTTEANAAEQKAAKEQRRQDYLQRIPIEGKFGQGKNGYGLNYIRARSRQTSEAWIRSIFLVMNLLILARIFLCPIKWVSQGTITAVLSLWYLEVRKLVLQRGAFFHSPVI